MIFNKLLPFYQKYGIALVLSGWLLFTLAFGGLTYLTHGENNTISCIFIVALCGWEAILLYWIFCRIFNKPIGKRENNLSITASCRLARILDIAYFTIITILLLILQFCDARPLAYYILITVLLGVLVISILLMREAHPLFNILKVLIFSALSSMAVFKQFYLAGMIDIGYFAGLNEVTAALGYMPEVLAGKQMLCPLNHLMIAVTKILTFEDIQIATICAVVVPSILITLAVYVIAKHFLGVRYGILAMLISNIPAYVIYLRYQANPTEWAWIYYVFLFLVVFLWFKAKDRKKIIFFVLMVATSILIVMAHQFGSFIVLALMFGVYLASVFVEGKIFTRMFIPALIYPVCLLFWWCMNPDSGINLVLAVMGNGLAHFATTTQMPSEKPEVPTTPETPVPPAVTQPSAPSTGGTTAVTPTVPPTGGDVTEAITSSGYIGIDPPNLFECIIAETPMVVLSCVCLLLPLLLLAARNVFQNREHRSFLWYIIIPLITGLGFFTCIWIFYTGMTIRIGCFLGVIFAFGLAYLFASFEKRSDTGAKKILHGVVVVGIICLFGFVNIATPMINDDTRLWREDYTITAEWSHADVVSADTLTDILPDSHVLRMDWMYTYPVAYQSHLKNYLEKRDLKNEVGNWYNILLGWSAYDYKENTFIMYREKMNSSPNNTHYRYGDNELESYSTVGYLDGKYQQILEIRGMSIYNIGYNTMYLE